VQLHGALLAVIRVRRLITNARPAAFWLRKLLLTLGLSFLIVALLKGIGEQVFGGLVYGGLVEGLSVDVFVEGFAGTAIFTLVDQFAAFGKDRCGSPDHLHLERS